MGGGGASHRTAVLSPRPKQHGRSSLGSIPSSPSLGRQRSGRYPHLQLQLLTLTLCVLGLAQMWGVGPNIGRALQRAARGASHVPAPDAHGIIAPGSGTGTGLDAAASGAGRSASAVASVNNPSSARTANEGGVAARMQAGAAWGLAAVAAGPDGSAAYNPDEWPRVYGGQAEPHSRILKRCSGTGCRRGCCHHSHKEGRVDLTRGLKVVVRCAHAVANGADGLGGKANVWGRWAHAGDGRLTLQSLRLPRRRRSTPEADLD